MKIDLYSAAGAKTGTTALPDIVFAADVNHGLIHQAVVRQQSNRRTAVAHVKTRGEVQGSTRKLFQQKGTGRARRGSVRSPVLRGGGKAFGPRNKANYVKDMPKKMRRRALISCLSAQASNGVMIALENYTDKAKTKEFLTLLAKLPVDIGRRILFVSPSKLVSLQLASRNVPGVKVITVDYLNPEDILNAKHIVFLTEAIAKTVELYASDIQESVAPKATKEPAVKKETTPAPKKAPAKKAPAKKTTTSKA